MIIVHILTNLQTIFYRFLLKKMEKKFIVTLSKQSSYKHVSDVN